MNPPPGVPANIGRYFEPGAPEHLRVALARGLVPLPPAERLSCLSALRSNLSATVREEAQQAWEELPEGFLEKALEDPALPPEVLDTIADLEAEKTGVLCRCLAHPALRAATAEKFAHSEDEQVVTTLAANQRLLVLSPDLARKLMRNPLLPSWERTRLEWLLGESEGDVEHAAQDVPDVPLPEGLPSELLEDSESAEDEGGQANLYQLVQGMSVAEKIKLATLGSKAARKLLIRDTNKLVNTAVLRSPKIREDEVLPIVQDRTVGEDVLRIVFTRKDWLKNYPIRLALSQNPKTPIPKSLRLLETLQEKDLRQLSKNRNVPGAVASGALRLLSRRGKV
jgi:hypothetical protein